AFMLFFRTFNQFRVIAGDFIDLPHRNWTEEDWMDTGYAEVAVDLQDENGSSTGIVVQVATSITDLNETFKKAKDLRYKKNFSLAKILTFFRRFKSGRDHVPPMRNLTTEDEQTDADLDAAAVRVKALPAQHQQQQEIQLPSMPAKNAPLTTRTISNESAVETTVVSTGVSTNLVSHASASFAPQPRGGGRFQSNLRPYIQSLQAQGIDPFSPDGHTHLLLLVLTEVTKLKQTIAEIRPAASMANTNTAIDLGLPIKDREEYAAFSNRVKEKNFRQSIVAYLRRLGGQSVDRMITSMVDALLATDFQRQFNLTGKDYSQQGRPRSKISFRESIEPIISEAMATCKPPVTSAEVTRRISRYLQDVGQRCKALTRLNPQPDGNEESQTEGRDSADCDSEDEDFEPLHKRVARQRET
ncbi:hypothetical protein BOX15_Mlig012075g11, partial [Macrostomum lignano]